MLTQERLKELVSYSPDTGLFTAIKNRKGSKNKTGSILGSFTKAGYIEFAIDGKNYYAHRLAVLYMTGCLPEITDHINRNRSDNRWTNLRVCTQQVNTHNDGLLPRSHSILKWRGVYSNHKKYIAKININHKQIYLGTFNTPEEAHMKYVSEKLKYQPNVYEG